MTYQPDEDPNSDFVQAVVNAHNNNQLTITSGDIEQKVLLSLHHDPDGFDVEAIVRDIIDTYGLIDVETIGHDAYWELVKKHATTENINPKSFFEEIVEIFGDLRTDTDESTVKETDPEVMKFLAKTSLICMVKDEADMPMVIRRLSTTMLWMIMIGREHQARGYTAPILRSKNEGEIPDYIVDMFEGN